MSSLDSSGDIVPVLGLIDVNTERMDESDVRDDDEVEDWW
jgi:hypothetical protein